MKAGVNRPTVERVKLGSATMKVETPVPEALAVIHDRFGRETPDTDETDVTLRVHATNAGSPHSFEHRQWQELENCRMTETEGGIALTMNGRSTVVAQGSHVDVYLHTTSIRRLVTAADAVDISARADWKQVGSLMQFGVAFALVGPNRLLAHGATVADGNQAILVVGLSGQGKSTTALSALSSGLQLMGDDLAVVDLADRSVTGVQRRPVVPADQAHRLGFSGTEIKSDGDRRRLRLHGVETQSGPAELIGLVEVGHHNDDGALSPLGRADLAILDNALAVPPFPPVLRRHLPVISALTTVPKAELLHAADPVRRIERGAEMLYQAFDLFRATESPD